MVRDLKQTAALRGSDVVVTSWVGRRRATSYLFPVDEWRSIERGHGNPVWWKREYVRRLTADLDAQPGGPEQAERIRDAQIAAIDAALATPRP